MSILAYVESATATGTAPTIARIFTSPTGLIGTWTEQPTLTDDTSFFDSRVGAVPGVRGFIGQTGPAGIGAYAYEPLAVIARTEDGGGSFVGAYPDVATDFPDLPGVQSAWLVQEFLDYTAQTPGVVFAVTNYPTYNDFGFTVISLLKSTDSGETFSIHVPAGIDDQVGCECGLVCASGRILLARQALGVAAFHIIYKSDDGGDTFTGVNTANSSGTATRIFQLIQMASGRVVALGSRNAGGVRRPQVFYSDDEGDSWVASNTPIDLTGYGVGSLEIRSAVAVGTVAVCSFGGDGASAVAAHKPFRLSADGITFNVVAQGGTYDVDPIVLAENGNVLQMTVADDGAVLGIQGGTGTIEVDDLSVRIWRGVLNGGETDIAWESVFTATVPEDQTACQHSYIYNIGESVTPTPTPPVNPFELQAQGVQAVISTRIVGVWRA